MIKSKITAIGEILFDIYPTYKRIGGAPFNFIYHIWKFTGNGSLISKIGRDNYGSEILSFLNKTGFDISTIQLDDKHPTGSVNVELDDNKTPSFVISSDTAYDNILLNEKIIDEFNQKTELLYFGTLAQRNIISRNTIQSLWGKGKKYFCDVNLRQNYYSKEIIQLCLTNSNVVKLNKDELKLISQFENIYKNNLEDSAKKLADEYEIEIICVTKGEEGAVLINSDDISTYSHKPDKVVDTLGAGDAYAAMLCLGYVSRWNLNKINQLATEFSADICEIEGALPQNDKIYNKYLERM